MRVMIAIMTPRQYYQGILEECQGGWLIFAWASQDQRTNRQARDPQKRGQASAKKKTRILANFACFALRNDKA
jgi:hypothetical protein